MRGILVVLLVILLIGCSGERPVEPKFASLSDGYKSLDGSCEWTEPVQDIGDSTLEYDHTFSSWNESDECQYAPIRYRVRVIKAVETVDFLLWIDGVYCGVWSEGIGYTQNFNTGDYITLVFWFPDDIEDYSVGDTWSFRLE